MERLAEVLPPSMGYEWSGLSLDEQESGNCTDNFWSGNCLRLSGFGCPVRELR